MSAPFARRWLRMQGLQTQTVVAAAGEDLVTHRRTSAQRTRSRVLGEGKPPLLWAWGRDGFTHPWPAHGAGCDARVPTERT